MELVAYCSGCYNVLALLMLHTSCQFCKQEKEKRKKEKKSFLLPGASGAYRNHRQNKVGSRVEFTTNCLSVSFRHVTFWIATLSLCVKAEKKICAARKI